MACSSVGGVAASIYAAATTLARRRLQNIKACASTAARSMARAAVSGAVAALLCRTLSRHSRRIKPLGACMTFSNLLAAGVDVAVAIMGRQTTARHGWASAYHNGGRCDNDKRAFGGRASGVEGVESGRASRRPRGGRATRIPGGGRRRTGGQRAARTRQRGAARSYAMQRRRPAANAARAAPLLPPSASRCALHILSSCSNNGCYYSAPASRLRYL